MHIRSLTTLFTPKRTLQAAAVLLTILLVATFAYLLRATILSNARALGDRLAQSFAAEEEARFEAFDFMLTYSAEGVEALRQQGAPTTDLTHDLELLSSSATHAFDGLTTRPFLVLSNDDTTETVAPTAAMRADHPTPAQETWYQRALDHPDALTISDTHQGASTGTAFITVARALSTGDGVLALDIPLDQLTALPGAMDLPDHASYFLYDRTGNLISAATTMDISGGVSKTYRTNLRRRILDGRLEDEAATYTGIDGMERSIFYAELDSGWLSVITMPTSDVLSNGWDSGMTGLAVACTTLLVIIIVLAITDRVRAQRMHRISRTLQILGNTFYAIYLINYQRGTYTTIKANPDTQTLLPPRGSYATFQEAMVRYLDPATAERYRKSFSLQNIARIAADNIGEFGGEYRRRTNGTYRWTSIRLINDPSLRAHELILCFRFVDDELRERNQTIELLESSLKAAHESAQRKDIFFKNISHDMRTPINAIIGMTRLLRDHMNDPDQAERYVSLVEDAGEQLAGLVEDVLDISHSEHVAQGVLALAPVDIAQVVKRACAPFQERADREQKTLTIQIAAPHTTVLADARRLRQILNNLISNSFKYSYAGSQITVTLASELRDVADTRRTCGYRFIVADTGVGMSEEFLPRIFEPYEREEIFAPRDATGTGLGMPIVRNLVEQMGGSIAIESTLGVGTTITVSVPFGVVDEHRTLDGHGAQDAAAAATVSSPHPASAAAEHAVTETAPQATPAPDEEHQAPRLAGRRVLVAEDNAANTIIVEALLDELGITAVCVTDGQAAVDAVAAEPPATFDAILMDMQMPRLDGCAAARAIRALPQPDATTIPIIAITANAFADDNARALSAGMTGYLTKPINIAALRRALAQAFESAPRASDQAYADA